MSLKKEHISVRTTRLNNLILGNSQASSKTNKNTADALYREGLLDALNVVYNEYNKDVLKKRDKNISDFTTKYRSIIEETNILRVNSEDFKVKAQIGKGYFGNVYLVEEKTTGDIYAMKKIKKMGVSNSQVKEERDIMAKRTSEWITSLQYAFQDVDHLYLVMEYLPGGDLLSLMIRNGPFNEELAKFYLAELTLAIHALHTMGYVHRDIKPENILIDRFGHIKLGDFGNAAALDKDGYVTSLSPVGTPDYIAPELLQTISVSKLTKSVHDIKCDYWSMGVIGYELIFETTPFHEDCVHETYSKILSLGDNSSKPEPLSYPPNINISSTFKSLLEGLIVKPSLRLTYTRIMKHPFFKDIKWDNLHQQVPPIIPTVKGNDDISNFEDIERNKGRKSTFIKKPTPTTKFGEFVGKDLPFLGYGFVYEEKLNNKAFTCDDNQIGKMSNRIKELQKITKGQTNEILNLQEKLLRAERSSIQSNSLGKILKDSKDELNRYKDKLKEKTIELAACRTEIKTLRSSLKIEEEMRLKNEASITDVLNSTYHKWEKAKKSSDQNYEKQLSEKNTEISNITQKLVARENELIAKSEECTHLQKKVENYKEMLKSIKDRNNIDKADIEKVKQQTVDAYEAKIRDLTSRLKEEKNSKYKLDAELRNVKSQLDESINSANNNQQAKMAMEKNMEMVKTCLNQEVQINNNLRSQNAELQKQLTDSEKLVEQLRNEVERLKQELQLIEYSKTIELGEHVSPYQTAHGSLTELNAIEEQLRNDLEIAKKQEDKQRKRAEELEKALSRLEALVLKLEDQPQSMGDILEKKNEKLEDQLATAREQIMIERQSAKTARLSLWKLEKQVEDMIFEKKTMQKKLDSADEKLKKLQDEKADLYRRLKESEDTVKQRELRINELKEEISNLSLDLQKKHKMWENSEQDRMKEKSNNIENVSRVHKIEEKIQELTRKFEQVSQKNDGLTLENNSLMKEINEERERTSSITDKLNESQMKLRTLQQNYELLKKACSITDTQLEEMEQMLDKEQKLNKSKQEKLDSLWKSIREKDEEIGKLKRKVDTEKLMKDSAQTRVREIEVEKDELKKELEDIRKQIISQKAELTEKTSNLFGTQEKYELLLSEFNNLQVIASNFEKQIAMLKEENSQILTSLYMAKEEVNKLSMELKNASQYIIELQQEIEQLNGTLLEQKNYYMQRDVKSEATLAQHKKLIDYLQIKVEDLSQKKKKTLADKIFGGSTTASKKENISPNAIESSMMYRTLQEELKREKQMSKQLKEELMKVKENDFGTVEVRNQSPKKENKYPIEVNVEEQKKRNSVKSQTSITSSIIGTPKNHRFELARENSEVNCGVCIVCQNSIVVRSPFWLCKECKKSVHRKCRGDVRTLCGEVENSQIVTSESVDEEVVSMSEDVLSTSDNEEEIQEDGLGDLILKSNITSPLLEIHCVFEIFENIILLGCTTGLFSYQLSTNSLVHITGIDYVTCIAITEKLSKAILVGANGEYLYQCDLRHLQNRSQASTCLKPKLETSVLDLSFVNRTPNEKWHLVKISNEIPKAIDTVALAATSTRIVIMKYDLNMQEFKPIRALDSAMAVSSILFTRHTAIVSSDKFFEIDLSSYSAEEFVDMSDATLAFVESCHPMNAFRISSQEFLLCFNESGVFVDEYGCRSRPYNLFWEYMPTGFIYKEPLLYVCHFHVIQVIRIHRSYSNELAVTTGSDVSDEPDFLRAYLNTYMSTLVGESGSGKISVYATIIEKDTNLQQLYLVDGIKVLKDKTNVSLETLSSQGTCVTLDSGPVSSLT